MKHPKTGYILCLGAGTQQIPLLQAVAKQGYAIIAVDRNSTAPGLTLATHKIIHDIWDAPGIWQKLAFEYRSEIVAVVTRSFGAVTVCQNELASRLDLPATGLDDLKLFQNKRYFRTAFQALNIPMAPLITWNCPADRQTLLDYPDPLLAKPATGHGKLGIQQLLHRSERQDFLDQHPEDDGQVMIEAIVGGPEYTVLGWVCEGQYQSLCVTEKITSSDKPLFIELQHNFPIELDQKIVNKIDQILQSIVTHSGLRNCPMVAEFKIPDSLGDPVLIECAPESGGEYLVDQLVPTVYQNYPYFDRLIELYKSIDHRTKLSAALRPPLAERAMTIRFVAQRDGRFEQLRWPDGLLQHPGLVFYFTLAQAGQALSITGGNRDRIAVFGLAAELEDAPGLQQEADQICSQIEVVYQS